MATLTQLLNHPALKGVSHLSCAALDEWDADMTATHREVAHAHIGGKHEGWICIRKLRDFNRTTLRHEIAHLIRSDKRHDEAWRRVVRELGGQVERRYRKRL